MFPLSASDRYYSLKDNLFYVAQDDQLFNSVALASTR